MDQNTINPLIWRFDNDDGDMGLSLFTSISMGLWYFGPFYHDFIGMPPVQLDACPIGPEVRFATPVGPEVK